MNPNAQSSALENIEMEPVSVTIPDASKALGLGKTKIYALVNEGRLDAVKIGRRTLIKTASIRRLIDGAGA